jgi:hypothetical protein
LQDLYGIITPSALHFERHHAGAAISERQCIGPPAMPQRMEEGADCNGEVQ